MFQTRSCLSSIHKSNEIYHLSDKETECEDNIFGWHVITRENKGGSSESNEFIDCLVTELGVYCTRDNLTLHINQGVSQMSLQTDGSIQGWGHIDKVYQHGGNGSRESSLSISLFLVKLAILIILQNKKGLHQMDNKIIFNKNERYKKTPVLLTL